MQAAILAGGLATRLRPLTDDTPKAMVLVQGKPFLEHQIGLLRSQGISDIVLCVGYLAARIQEHFGDGGALGVRIRYSDEGARLLGTAGALKKAEPLLGEAFFVLDGDAYLPLDYQEVMARFKAAGKQALMVVFENRDQHESSNVVVAGDMVQTYDRGRKLPGMVHVHAGLSILRKDALALIPGQEVASQDELWPQLIARRELPAFLTTQRPYEVGSPGGLEEFRRFLGPGPR